MKRSATADRIAISSSTGRSWCWRRCRDTTRNRGGASDDAPQTLQLFDRLRQPIESRADVLECRIGHRLVHLRLRVGLAQAATAVAFLGNETAEQFTGDRIDRRVLEQVAQQIGTFFAVAEYVFELLAVADFARRHTLHVLLELLIRLLAFEEAELAHPLLERGCMLLLAERHDLERRRERFVFGCLRPARQQRMTTTFANRDRVQQSEVARFVRHILTFHSNVWVQEW